MSMKLAPDVKAEPYVKLTHWMLVEGPHELKYFVGRCEDTGQSRVSSAIRYFDADKGRGTTYSGRVYALVGEPGIDAEIRRIFERWLSLSQISDWRDVSSHVATLMDAPSTLSKKIDEGRKRRAGDVSPVRKEAT